MNIFLRFLCRTKNSFYICSAFLKKGARSETRKQFLGRLAQLVQSIWFTPRGSAVRIRHRPLKRSNVIVTVGLFCFNPNASLGINLKSSLEIRENDFLGSNELSEGKQTLRINFGKSKQEKTDIPNSSELISESFNLCIERFCRGIGTAVVKIV